jgi:hypothetical protein
MPSAVSIFVECLSCLYVLSVSQTYECRRTHHGRLIWSKAWGQMAPARIWEDSLEWSPTMNTRRGVIAILRTGAPIDAGTRKNEGTHRFEPPGAPRPGNDWVLVLDNAAERFTRPGAK